MTRKYQEGGIVTDPNSKFYGQPAPQGLMNTAPNYQDFLQSDFYKQSQNKIAPQVIDPVQVGGQTYNFGNPVIGQAYRNYMASIGQNTGVGKSSGPIMGGPLDGPLKFEQVAQPMPDMAQQQADTPTDNPLAGKTGEELQQAVILRQAEQADMTALPTEQQVTPTPLKLKPGEELAPSVGVMGEVAPVEAAPAIDTAQFVQAAPTPATPVAVEAATVGEVAAAEAATAELSAGSLMEAAQGQLSPQSMAVAATAELDPKGTVKYQMEELLSTIKDGQPLPAWAAPAVRQAAAVMQQRGLGSSSMAAAAMVTAVMESGIPIAASDAKTYATLQLQNLNNKQQAVLQNAAASAQMDMANLNAQQQANVNNAKAFLSIDLQNLTNEQQSATISYQGQLQAMLTDQAAVNAAAQFNAKSQMELDMFFEQLGSQVESATLNRVAAIEQYNVSQTNAMSQFNTQMDAAREQFNANMSAQIAQSNAQWRRDINTANTATQNAANQQNVMNLLSLSQQSLANLWQTYRDQAAWTMQISENREARAHNAAMQAQAIAANSASYSDQFEDMLIVRSIDNIFGALS